MTSRSDDRPVTSPTLRFHTSGGTVDEATVDEWELVAARRALMNLKTLLHGQPVLDLLNEQIEAADRRYAALVAASDAEYRECRVDVTAEGLTATQFLEWFAETMTMTPDVAAIERIYPAHPEHYFNPPRPGIVEVIGGQVARLSMDLVVDLAEMPAAISQLANENYPYKVAMKASLQDGTVFGYLLHELRDSPEGCNVILRMMLPAAAPDDFCESHSQHFSIEFRYWLRAAALATGEATETQKLGAG